MCDEDGLCDEVDCDDENQESLYIKYLFDGVESLADLAAAFRGFADHLDAQAGEGWRMQEPVDGGWAHLRRDPAIVDTW